MFFLFFVCYVFVFVLFSLFVFFCIIFLYLGTIYIINNTSFNVKSVLYSSTKLSIEYSSRKLLDSDSPNCTVSV